MSKLEKTARRAVPRKPRLAALRWKVQIFSLVALNSLWFKSWRSGRADGVCLPVLNCHGCPAAATYCPVGVVGDMLKLHLVPWLALGLFGLVGVIFGRISCGWVCPFGFLQDLMSKIPVPRWNPPRWTKYTKYAVLLGMVILVPLFIGTDSNWFFCGICPDATLMANGWYLALEGTPVPWDRLAFLVGFLALMLFVRRGFCRLVCPIGAGLALFNRVSLLSVKYRRRTCSGCGQCVPACPVGRGPMADQRSPECVYCLDCFKCSSLELDFADEGGARPLAAPAGPSKGE